MNVEIKKQWVETLRSGKYKQGIGYLKHLGRLGVVTHCCLGVLGEILKEEEPDLNDRALLQMSALNKAGLTVFEHGHLATMNDSGTSFEKIADYIEEKL